MSDKIILIRETILESLIKDGAAIAGLAFMSWFNFHYCGGSGWIFAAIAVGWIAALTNLSSKRRTIKQAREWFDRHYPIPSQDSQHG